MPRALTALLAEDEVLIRLDVFETLKGLGLQVTEVGTADEGVAIIRNGAHFDLVVTDVNMPGKLDGLDLAREVRRSGAETKIAMMSGKVGSTEAIQHLFDVFIAKPFYDLDGALTVLLLKPKR